MILTEADVEVLVKRANDLGCHGHRVVRVYIPESLDSACSDALSNVVLELDDGPKSATESWEDR